MRASTFQSGGNSLFSWISAVALLVVGSAWELRAEDKVLITEFMAENEAVLKDEDGNYSDWVEIFNDGSTTVNLAGWTLSDDLSNLKKWTFPSTNLPPGNYMVVFASGKNRRVPGKPLHTGFSLSKSGESLALTRPDGTNVVSQFTFGPQEPNVSMGYTFRNLATNFVVDVGATLKAYVPTNDIGSNWVKSAFDDSGWRSGTSGVGFDLSTTNTTRLNAYVGLDVGDAMAGGALTPPAGFVRRASAYVRLGFTAPTVLDHLDLQLWMQYDDGFVAYVNGQEVGRRFFTGTPRYTSTASAARANTQVIIPENIVVAGGLNSYLGTGQNVLAVHGMNRAATDPDFLILPRIVAVKYEVATNDSRFFALPTPGMPNSEGAAAVAEDPVVSVRGGIYDGPVTVSISSRGAAADEVIRYTVDRKDPTETSPIYTTSLTFSNQTWLRARVFRPGYLPSSIVSEHYTFLDKDMTNFTSNLPIIVISTFGTQIQDAVETQTGVRVIPTSRGRASIHGEPELVGYAGVAQRGSSSTQFPKPSLSFELRDQAGDDKDFPLLGMPSDSDWILYAPYTDKSFMRDALAYRLVAEMGWWSSRFRFVEVFLDRGSKLNLSEDYQGIYVLLEKIKVSPNRVDIPELGPQDNALPEVSGGYIFKKDRLDATDVGFNTTTYSSFGWVSPKEQNVTPAQKSYLTGYLNAFEAGLYGGQYTNRASTNFYGNYIDVDSFVDNHWMVESAKQIDGYRLSNFMHKERNGKLKMMPIWDWNLSFGNANYLEGDRAAGWYYTQVGGNDYPWFERLFTAPDYRQRRIDRWAELRQKIYRTDHLFEIVEEWTALLSEAQARDFKRWPRLGVYIWPNADADYPNKTHRGHIDYMKKFIADRFKWIDSQFLPTPKLTLPEGWITVGSRVEVVGDAPTNVTWYYTLDGTDPRLNGGSINPQAVQYTGPITLAANSRVFLRGRHQTNAWSAPAVATYVTALPQVLISEVMYHPAATANDGLFAADDFEFVEIYNPGTTPLDLTGAELTEGVQFSFTGSAVKNLAAGARVVVVKNEAAFRLRYGNGPIVAGAFTGSLDNAGEELVLLGRMKETLARVKYGGSWHDLADGYGFSLELVSEVWPSGEVNTREAWRLSGAEGGTPGARPVAAPAIAPIVISEVVPVRNGQPDAIELYNPTAASVDIGGWYLTDDRRQPRKYRIPSPKTIPAKGYLVFTEQDFGGVSDTAFALNELGDEVYLYSGDGTRLTGYVDGFDYSGAEPGVTLIRYEMAGTGEVDHPLAVLETLSGPNAAVAVGPVVISELHFHPQDVLENNALWDNSDDEFIEIRNVTAQAVKLYDTAYPDHTWKVRGGVSFEFPSGAEIPAGGAVLLVNFDPIARPAALQRFRNLYASGATPVFGPYGGKLSNSGDSVRLYRPGVPATVPPEDAGKVPEILVDRVDYGARIPASIAADGSGASLQRRGLTAYGNEPSNWYAALPSAGNEGPNGDGPEIQTQPESANARVGQNVTFRVTASGQGDLHYQWLKGGTVIPGATTGVLSLALVQESDAGEYRAVVWNNDAAVSTVSALLNVLVPPTIHTQPESVYATRGSTALLSVGAEGVGPIGYQWQRDGVDILGQTNAWLRLANLDTTLDGNSTNGVYSVRVSNANGVSQSLGAAVVIPLRPEFLVQPSSLSVLAGEDAVFYSRVKGNWPLTFRWRRGSVSTNLVVADTESYYRISNVQAANAATVSVLVSNQIGNSITSSNVVLTVLADFDRDGMSDLWEVANGFATNNVADGGLDSDGDGVSNRDEYVAGTNPNDKNSYLTVALNVQGDERALSFQVMSNRTYTVLFREGLDIGEWHALASVGPWVTNGVANVTDSLPSGRGRIYRLVSPQWLPNRLVGPAITVSPRGLSVAVGSPWQLSVEAAGKGNLRYQWLKDGTSLGVSGAGPILDSGGGGAVVGDAGVYEVQVWDDDGSVRSLGARVVVE